ncbi:P-loop containing nucleoside triphosphate hydrolase protein [Fomitiporia mediterranea MF3/22]|uniref:P-loop containing nucleoside triphosphate hydrolase protein n=1 Tax=Fomitiporia mediterranea (strain MF3/22) TaxID=694068 RepID=UPI0004409C2F|nr:P-loop containing nucleoside triphosphate hydrolase protein [Fomitiporia mediterranea MF3/22]EJD04257.1 P-loop containing nucleoside triphosphate hydrolase protein [Fomitiporia mediterranea MF3/22]
MESFQLLSRGGVQFDKKRFKADVQLFDRKYEQASEIGSEGKTRGDLPSELDFFKYTQGAAPKRKIRQASSSHENGEASREETKRVKFDAVHKEEGPSQPRHRVTVKGTNVSDPVHTFEALQEKFDVSPRIIQNLKEYGYSSPTDIQSYATPIMLQGRDLAAISPTGTGKTLSYLVPIFSLLKAPNSSSKVTVGSGVRAVILAPTRELAHQIHNECMKIAQGRKWKMVLLSKATASTLADKAVRVKVDIIVSTPLRLVDSMQRCNLELDNVQHLVLDEADRLLDSEFLSQTQEVMNACMRENVQKAVFSATLPAGAEKIAMGALRNPVRIIVGLKDTPLPSITQKLVYVADESSKLPTLLQYLSQPYSPPIIIFTSTQPRASSLAEQLVLNSVQNVDCLHAGMSMKERQDAASRMRKGDSWVMICTDVMARGMDFKGVQGVINFDFPRSVQSYIHRIGRTGRAGREGLSITYFTNEDAPFLKPIANVLLQSGSTVPEWMLKLPKPSRMKRRDMGKIERGDAVTKSDRIGRMIAVKKRELIEVSKRRKVRDNLGHVVRPGVEEDFTDPRSDDGVS